MSFLTIRAPNAALMAVWLDRVAPVFNPGRKTQLVHSLELPSLIGAQRK